MDFNPGPKYIRIIILTIQMNYIKYLFTFVTFFTFVIEATGSNNNHQLNEQLLELSQNKYVTAEQVKELIAQGANVNTVDKMGRTPLLIACANGCDTIFEELLATVGINVNIANEGGYTPLHAACILNNVNMVRALLTVTHIDVNMVDKFGRTPIHLTEDSRITAMINNHIEESHSHIEY